MASQVRANSGCVYTARRVNLLGTLCDHRSGAGGGRGTHPKGNVSPGTQRVLSVMAQPLTDRAVAQLPGAPGRAREGTGSQRSKDQHPREPWRHRAA